jgi:hypothetical protein
MFRRRFVGLAGERRVIVLPTDPALEAADRMVARWIIHQMLDTRLCISQLPAKHANIAIGPRGRAERRSFKQPLFLTTPIGEPVYLWCLGRRGEPDWVG